MLAQSSVNQSLVIPAASRVDLIPKSLKDIFVNANRDPNLPWRRLENRSSCALSEIVFFFHDLALVAGTPSRRRFSGRYDPDAIFAPSVDNNQQSTKGICSKSDKALLSRGFIMHGDYQVVVQHRYGISKIVIVLLEM